MGPVFHPPKNTPLGFVVSWLIYPITNLRVCFFCIELIGKKFMIGDTLYKALYKAHLCNYLPSPRHSGPDSLEAFALLSFCSSSRCLSAHDYGYIPFVPWMLWENNFSLDENSEKLYGKSVNFPGTLKPTSFI